MWKIILAMLSTLVFASAALGDRPSFDCSRAEAPDEKAICGDDLLSSNDQETTRLFQVLKASDKQAALRVAREFLAHRKLCGSNVSCIRRTQEAAISNFRERISNATTQPPPFEAVPNLTAEAKDPRLSAMLPDIQKGCSQRKKRSEACRREQTSAAREYLDIRDNIIGDEVKSTMMTGCVEKTGRKSVTDWTQVVSCFKSGMDAHNRAALVAEEEQARKAAEQRRLDEARRAEEQKKAEEEAARQAEARRIDQDRRFEEERAAKAKFDADVAETAKPQECTEPSSSELETIRDNFEIDLYDAQSARFNSACKYTNADHPDRTFICGLINSKNAMGAYVGHHPFYAVIETAQIKDIVTDGGNGDETKALIREFQLTSHCQYCTTANRSHEVCRQAVKSGKYDPLEAARSRRQ